MAQIFTTFLLTSLIGTGLAFLLTLLKPITRKQFSSGWHYYMWLVVLLVMILPIRLNLPETATTPISETNVITDNQIEEAETPITPNIQQDITIQEHTIQAEKVYTIKTAKDFLNSNLWLFSLVWCIGAILIFLIKMISYIVFLIKIYKHTEIIPCPELKAYKNRKIRTRVSDTICSPLIIGLFRPTLLLPKSEITPEQLQNVLAHESTHLKRNDILYKWFVCIVKCIHWFNPAIYFISQQVYIDCEISCDLAVVNQMNEQEEKGYMETILALLTPNNKKAISITTGMTGSKKTLKRRFAMIKNRKRTGKVTQVISVVLAVIVLATTLFTSGVLATELLKEDFNPSLEIEVMDNGNLIQFYNKPFYENGEVYLPLRELLEKTGLVPGEKSKIEWNNGKITLCLTKHDNIPNYDSMGNIEGTKSVAINYYFEIEIGKAEYILNPEGTLPPGSQHLSQSKKMSNAPILKNSTTYIPYEYVDWMINRTVENHQIAVRDIIKTADNVDNAENMSYEDIRSLQLSVDNGHFPWRLDYEQVIMAFLSGKGINVEGGKITAFAGDSTKCSATYSVGETEYLIELFKPIDKTEKGVWVVKAFKNKNTILINEIFFYDTTPGQSRIEKQEDGWYNIKTSSIIASFPDIDTPTCVSAYFTPTGTEMEDSKKELAKISAPYTYQTMAKVLSMNITFPSEYTMGHLWFVFEFENGEKISSQLYNMYISRAKDNIQNVAKVYEVTPNEVAKKYMQNSKIVITTRHYELNDGTWKTDTHSYKYRLEITGRLNNAVKDSTFLILSNTKDITFEQTWKASGLSSNINDYFKPETAIIVGRSGL